MGRTAISWATDVWNPTTGCFKVSAGCAHCYAEALARRFWKDRAFTDVRCHPERLGQPLHWRKPRRVFVDSMSDLFHPDVPDAFLLEVFRTMHRARQHTFLVLTKRPERMRDFVRRLGQEDWVLFLDHLAGGMAPHLDHVWLGVSIENQAAANERIPPLLQTPAAIRFVSMEPLLGPITILREWRGAGHPHAPQADEPSICCCGRHRSYHVRLDWVIVGGESGPRARPMELRWLEFIVRQCRDAGVPVFVKQDSGPRPGQQGRIPDELWIQEWPAESACRPGAPRVGSASLGSAHPARRSRCPLGGRVAPWRYLISRQSCSLC